MFYTYVYHVLLLTYLRCVKELVLYRCASRVAMYVRTVHNFRVSGCHPIIVLGHFHVWFSARSLAKLTDILYIFLYILRANVTTAPSNRSGRHSVTSCCFNQNNILGLMKKQLRLILQNYRSKCLI
jgi:hypothetical protein